MARLLVDDIEPNDRCVKLDVKFGQFCAQQERAGGVFEKSLELVEMCEKGRHGLLVLILLRRERGLKSYP
jgi:hypothetical protein